MNPPAMAWEFLTIMLVKLTDEGVFVPFTYIEPPSVA